MVFNIKNKLSNKGFIGTICLYGAAFAVTVLFLIMGVLAQKQEEIRVGSVSPQRFVAVKDTVDEAATEKLKLEAAKSVGPLYAHDEEIQTISIDEMTSFFQALDALLATKKDGQDFFQLVKSASLKLPVVLTSKHSRAYETLSPSDRIAFRDSCINVAVKIYEQGVTTDHMEKTRELIQESLDRTSYNGDLKEMGQLVLGSAIQPNLVLDGEAMELAREKKQAEIEDVVIKKNQKIVDEGDIITQEIYDKLEALNLIKPQDYKKEIAPLLGSIGTVLLLFALTGLYFASLKKDEKLKQNERRMLFTLYLITIFIVKATSGLTIFTIIPLHMFAMLVSLLVHIRTALVLNCFMAIIGCLLYNGDMEFLFYFIITGSFGTLIINYTEKRKYAFSVALCMAGISFLSMLVVGMFFEKRLTTLLLLYALYGAASGIFTVLIAIGSLPLWEAGFEANTPLRLLELTNPNSKVLRRLMLEAPGTYHHSLLVANLAEMASIEIGANAALARVGAYYHDIGKLKLPLYFSENQAGENPHDFLSPLSSAQMIRQHIKNGVELGEEEGLPKAIVAIIREHHGTSMMKYFYFKALKYYGSEEIVEQDYRYKGPIPQSKEAAVVMLADTVEAAVRSRLGNGDSLDTVESFVSELIKDKLDDGQLQQSFLTFNDLDTIRNAFMNVFHGMYHDRIAYPKQEELKKAKEEKAKELQMLDEPKEEKN